MSERSFKEEFVIEEYKLLWDYYNKTIIERKHLFDWFLLIITIPSSLIGYLSFKKDGDFVIPLDISAYALLIIFFIGFSLFYTYLLASKNAGNYIKAIDNIRKIILDQPSPNEYKYLDEIKPLHAFRSEDKKGKGNSVKFYRSFIFIILNSTIFGMFLQLIILPNDAEKVEFGFYSIIGFIVAFFVQVVIYKYHYGKISLS